MYQFKWEPKDKTIADGNVIPAKFDGAVLVKVPSHVERIQFLKSIHTKIDEKGEMESDKASENAINLMSFAIKQIEKVELIRKEDKLVVNDCKWLEYDIDGATILKEIGYCLFEGVKLGKS